MKLPEAVMEFEKVSVINACGEKAAGDLQTCSRTLTSRDSPKLLCNSNPYSRLSEDARSRVGDTGTGAIRA